MVIVQDSKNKIDINKEAEHTLLIITKTAAVAVARTESAVSPASRRNTS